MDNKFSLMKFFGGLVALFLAVMLLATVLSAITGGFPLRKVEKKYVALSYGGGMFEGEKYQGIHYGGESLFINGLWDRLYKYPNTARTYIISRNPAEGDRDEADVVVAPSNDNVQMGLEATVYFKLCQSEECLIAFHENIGNKMTAYTDEGWENMLNDYLRKQIENAWRTTASQYESTALYSDDEIQRSLEDEVGADLKDRVNEVLGGDYFCGPTATHDACPDMEFVVNFVKPINPEVLAEYERVAQSEIAIQTKQNEVKQAELEAEKVRVLTEDGNLTPEYVILEAIRKGQAVPFAPFLQNIRF